jgi:hypothetical protein
MEPRIAERLFKRIDLGSREHLKNADPGNSPQLLRLNRHAKRQEQCAKKAKRREHSAKRKTTSLCFQAFLPCLSCLSPSALCPLLFDDPVRPSTFGGNRQAESAPGDVPSAIWKNAVSDWKPTAQAWCHYSVLEPRRSNLLSLHKALSVKRRPRPIRIGFQCSQFETPPVAKLIHTPNLPSGGTLP